MKQSGRCLCGRVRYELEGELPPLVNCHCQFCRRAHGAAFATIAWVPSSSFRFTAGEELAHRSNHGHGFRCFCRSCGTRLFNGMVDGPFITLIIASLEEAPEKGPSMHINLESKAPWYEITDDLPQYQTVPPHIEAARKKVGMVDGTVAQAVGRVERGRKDSQTVASKLIETQVILNLVLCNSRGELWGAIGGERYRRCSQHRANRDQ
jgi:hypothetical protein